MQVSYAATSPALSARENYPTFFRLVAADSSHNGARTAFVRHFGWDTVATIHEDSETYALVRLVVSSVFRDHGVVTVNDDAQLLRHYVCRTTCLLSVFFEGRNSCTRSV